MDRRYLYKNYRLLSLLCVTFFITLLEVTLIELKYGVFTGGFLQPYFLESVFDQFVFIALGLLLDILLLSLAFIVLNRVFKAMLPHALARTLVIAFVLAAITFIVVITQYKILSYVSDTINLQIIKNLGGGSLADSARYIAEELTLFTVVLLGIATVGVLILRYGYRRLAQIPITQPEYTGASTLKILASIAFLILVLQFLLGSEKYHYVFSKKISYSLTVKLLNVLTDFDADGYGFFSHQKDEAPFNASISPRAVDVPDNGIDENTLMGDFHYHEVPSRDLHSLLNTARAKKNIVLIVLESARWRTPIKRIDGTIVAPNIARLAERGSFVTHAYSHTGFTTSSLKLLLGGDSLKFSRKAPHLKTLNAIGYQIWSASGQDSSFGGIDKAVGFRANAEEHFDATVAIDDRVYSSTDPGSLRLSEERVVQAFEAQVQKALIDRPQFFYVNLQAAHFPYSHPKMRKILTERFLERSEINEANKAELERMYWNAIASADWAVGEIINKINEKAFSRETIFVITSDHGESLYHDGFLGHGFALNDDQTRIFMVSNEPGANAAMVMGHEEIGDYILSTALGIPELHPDAERPVLQFIGELTNPVQISHVYRDGDRLIYDFRSRTLLEQNAQKFHALHAISSNEALMAQAKALINDWEHAVWVAQQRIKASSL